MRPQLLSVCLTAAVSTGFLAAPPRASANTVNLNFDQTTPASTVNVSISSGTGAGQHNNVIPGPYYWHEVNAPSGSLFPNPTTTFCTELTQFITTGNSYTFTTSTVLQALGGDTAKALAISELYAGHYNTAWENKNFAGSTDSTAFQLALWALVYDSDGSHSLSTGNLQVTSADSTAKSTAQNWLDTLGSQPSFASVFPHSQLVWLSNPDKQDQVTVIPTGGGGSPSPVPAPPGAVLAGIGFVGLIGRARWLKRKPAAV